MYQKYRVRNFMIPNRVPEFFFLQKNNLFLYVFDRFNTLILKNNFLKIKNIILMYFSTKNTLKNNCNHTPKQTLNHFDENVVDMKYNNLFLCFKNIF